MKQTKECFKRAVGWFLCVAMLLSMLPPSAIATAAAEPELLVTVDNAGIYSKMDAQTDKHITDRVPVNTILEIEADEMQGYSPVMNDRMESFYKVSYKVNGKTKKGYMLSTHVMPFFDGVQQPKGSTMAHISGLKNGETARVYYAKGESLLAYAGIDLDPKLSNGAMVFVKGSTSDGWTEIYFGDSATQFVETKYVSLDKAGGAWTPTPTPSPTPKPSPTPRPTGAKYAEGKITVKDTVIYDDKELNVKLATLPVNTVVTMVSTKQISDAYKNAKLYEVMYQAAGKNVIGYVKANNLNVYENGIKSPAGTTKECIQGLLHYKELEVKQNGKVIGWLMNNADVDVYKKDAKTATINFNGVKATVESKYVVTPTPTPTPTPTLSPVRTAKAGEYDVVAEGSVAYSTTKLLTNPSAREGAVETTLKVGTALDIVSAEKVASIDAFSEDVEYYKIVYKGKNGLGYYYVLDDEVTIRSKGQVVPSYLVDGKVSGIKSGYTREVRSSMETYSSKNIIAKVSTGAKLKIDPTESINAWTKVYINNQEGYILTKFVTRDYTSSKSVLTADTAGLTKAYPNMDIIAQAYLVGTDSVVQEKNTIEIKPVEPYTLIQNEFISEEDVPENGYVAHEASTLSVVYYDYDKVIFWSNGYQLEKGDLDRIDKKADALKEVHTAGLYQVPRDAVLLDLGDAEVAPAGQKVKTVAEGMATATLGLNTAPQEAWDGYPYIVQQNDRVDLVSTEKIPATDGSDTTYYKVAITHGSTTGYLNKENVSYYYVDSDFINVYKNDFSNPERARAGVVVGAEAGMGIPVYAAESDSSKIIGYVANGANVDIRASSSKWAKIVFNSGSGYVKKTYVADAPLDKTGIPELGLYGGSDIYFTQVGVSLDEVCPELEVIYKAKVVGKDGKVTAGNYHTVNMVDPHTVIQGYRIAAKYFPDYNIENLKKLYMTYYAATSYQNFTFIDGAYLELEGQVLDVVACNSSEVIVWSPGTRSFTPDTLVVDCRQYGIQYNHPAGFYSIPRDLVELYSVD